MLTGTNTRRVDKKGRVVIPPEHRQLLGPSFILTRAPNGVLVLIPKKRWKDLAHVHRERAGFSAVVIASAIEVWPDRTTGRICIPLELREHAGIRRGDEVAVAGLGSCAVIAHNDRWTQRLELAERELLSSLGLPPTRL